MSGERHGQVVTFYSYKGGTGRTMALANVAWILASAGKRVLIADWDLEAPGLHRFFRPFLDQDMISDSRGVIDLIREYEDQVRQDADRPPQWVEELARVRPYAFSVAADWDFGGGSLDVLPAGRQNGAYASALSSLDWDTFYDRLGGAAFLDALRADMRRHYDYTLVDSRTGFSDVADICTQHLPDVLVDCFTLSDQGIEGAARVARRVDPRRIRVLPVAMRVDPAEKEKADAGRTFAMHNFPNLPAGMTESERSQYFASVEVPYQAYYAYEETLATFGDAPGSPTSLLAAYERLTSVITRGEVTSLVPIRESVRDQWRTRFQRQVRPAYAEIVLRYAAEDQIWAEWVASVLTAAGVEVVDGGPVGATAPARPSGAASAVLAVVSHNYAPPADDGTVPQLVLTVDDARPPERPAATAGVAGLAEEQAQASLLELVGRSETEPLGKDARLARFPGIEPRWFKVPARNLRFTGRTGDLLRLRRELRSDGRAVVLPVALQGMGGIGKTQLALEYVHRYGAAYDLVWWIAADPPQFVDMSLSDLGLAMGLSVEGTSVDMALSTLESLRRGRVTRRWLLVFDNADDLEHVRNFLPQGGGGHLLITSRNPNWKEGATAIEVDVFRREESIDHLRGRVPQMTREQADKVAGALGDLPIAVAAAGAWLADTLIPVDDYLHEIEKHGASTTAVQDTTWGLSLDRLRDQSPGAYRLLQFCSVLAPESALDLLYSDHMALALAPYDPSVSDRLMRGRLVHQINRLALLKLDTLARQVVVHRLLQEVVRKRMSPEELAETRHEVHVVLARFRSDADPDAPTSWPKPFRMIWPHLEVSGAVECNDESVRQLLNDRVRYLWRTGDLSQGLAFGQRVADSWTRRLERDPAEVGEPTVGDADLVSLRRQLLHLRFNIANILRDRADFAAARAIDEEVLAQQRELLGDTHPHTLMTSGSLAADLRALGRYGEALPLEERTYRAWLEAFGEDTSRTLMSANNLAVSLRAVGDFQGARSIDERVAELRQRSFGPADPYTLLARSALGRDLREAGEYEQSVAVLRTVHALSEQHLGPDAVGTLNAQANLAASLRSAGRAIEAADLLEEAYDVLNRRFGPTNPNTLACRLNRSCNLLAVGGDPAKALSELTAVTAAYEGALGPDHPFTLVCVSNQSAAWRVSGEVDEARKLAARALEGCRALLGEGHPYTLAAAMNVATCHFDAGELAAAVEGTAAAAERMAGELGPDHPDVLACRANLALLESATRRPGQVGAPDPESERARAAIGRLEHRLRSDAHPSVTRLREGKLLYRVIDPHDPF